MSGVTAIVLDAASEVIGVLTSSVDITARKRGEQELDRLRVRKVRGLLG